tara:strand:- start:198 stop:443 length:246 start_codon:yes stop_codon:yes gene_type:complete
MIVDVNGLYHHDFIDCIVEINGEERVFVAEVNAYEKKVECPKCGDINKESKLLLMDNNQCLYIGMCCRQFVLCEVNGEDNE